MLGQIAWTREYYILPCKGGYSWQMVILISADLANGHSIGVVDLYATQGYHRYATGTLRSPGRLLPIYTKSTLVNIQSCLQHTKPKVQILQTGGGGDPRIIYTYILVEFSVRFLVDSSALPLRTYCVLGTFPPSQSLEGLLTATK